MWRVTPPVRPHLCMCVQSRRASAHIHTHTHAHIHPYAGSTRLTPPDRSRLREALSRYRELICVAAALDAAALAKLQLHYAQVGLCVCACVRVRVWACVCACVRVCVLCT